MNVAILTNSEQNKRQNKSQLESMNREMKSIQLNYAQDKLLQINNSRLDKEMNKEHRCCRHTTQGLKQEQEVIKKCTPSADLWLKQHQGQYQAWKEREREKLLKRHKSLIRSYRISDDDTREKELKLVRSKTFVAKDKPDCDKPRRRSTLVKPPIVSGGRNSVVQWDNVPRRHSLAVSTVSSRRSSIDSLW